MKFLFVFAILVVVIAINGQSEATADWKEYKTKNNKSYNETVDGGKQEQMRKQVFLAKDAKIKKHNSGKSNYKLAHNKFSDRTDEELKMLLGTVPPSSFIPKPKLTSTSDDQNDERIAIRIPASLDYRNHTCLPPVKNQRTCGCCWAFSAIAPLEFSKCIKTKKAVVLSEQQMVDCDTASTNKGCSGGWYTVAWDYLKKAGGSVKDSFYPYTSSKNTCKFCSACQCRIGAKVSSYGYVASNNATEMQIALGKYGPLAVAFTVVSSFYNYQSGVYDDPLCDNKDVNHGVVAVGFGVLNGIPYWIVRNTWGTNWGLSGYFLMKRGVNKCKIETYAAYVVAV